MKNALKGILTAACALICVGGIALNGTNAAAYTNCDDKTELTDRTPECALFLEEAKVKNMTDWGYYNVNGEDAWYFYGDGSATGNPEVRFVTEGTQTVTKDPITNLYTFAPITIDSFSFTYRLDNDGEKGVVDLETEDYIVQILASDGTYPIFVPTIKNDGDWYTVTIDENTECNWNGMYVPMNQVKHLFSGFIFKMGGLKGDLMIKDIVVTSNGAELPPLNPYDGETETPETSEEPTESKDIWLDSEELETSEEPATSEELETSEESATSETSYPPMNCLPDEEKGCGATISSVYALGALTVAGFVVSLRKKKE